MPVVSLNLSQNVLDALALAAEAEDRSRSAMADRLLRRVLAEPGVETTPGAPQPVVPSPSTVGRDDTAPGSASIEVQPFSRRRQARGRP